MSSDKPSRWRVAWTAGRLAGRRVLGRKASDTDEQLAGTLTEQLDTMKGLAMKIGQIVSYMDVPLPPSVQATMARLQTGAVAMDADVVRSRIEEALGGAVEEHFDAFDWDPVAAASIGQVHRARLVSGLPVAVKVQYPSAQQSFRDDLRAVHTLAGFASLASAVDGKAIVRELADRLAEECDYDREARMQQAFARCFRGRAGIEVPDVVPACSTDTILTTRWVDGIDFEAFRTGASDTARSSAASSLVRFSYESLLVHCAIQADPHPGNFLFESDGGVTFLDFGCVRTFETAFVESLRDMITALDRGDRPRFAAAIRALGLVGRERGFDDDHFYAMMEHLHRPLLVSHFEFTGAYVREGYAFNGPTSPNARSMAMPAAYVWVARLQWGLWSTLARLGARGSFRPILDDLLATEVAPMHDPLHSPEPEAEVA